VKPIMVIKILKIWKNKNYPKLCVKLWVIINGIFSCSHFYAAKKIKYKYIVIDSVREIFLTNSFGGFEKWTISRMSIFKKSSTFQKLTIFLKIILQE
jgi:hypothetical protein